MSRLFLLPLLLALLWWAFLYYFQIPWRKGLTGFYWIIGLGGGLAAFLSLMIWLTH
ncbi:MAG: hypothetical protein LRY38_01170 [Aeromonadaceae bacterium]|nr:hypothetical protein [Aeromonadaceae bacterium]